MPREPFCEHVITRAALRLDLGRPGARTRSGAEGWHGAATSLEFDVTWAEIAAARVACLPPRGPI